jgi:hypothetical protein
MAVMARHLLLLFMVFQNILDLLREGLEAEPLVMQLSGVNNFRWAGKWNRP